MISKRDWLYIRPNLVEKKFVDNYCTAMHKLRINKNNSEKNG